MSIYFSLPAMMLASMAISFYVFIPKLYANTVSIEGIGLIILISRLFDAFTDPVVGYLSDRTKSNTGRRKPWINISVLPLCLAFVLLFFYELVPAEYHFYYLLILSLLFFLFWTTYSIPYDALAQELVTDYNKRTVLFSYRDGAIVIGTLLAAIIPAIFESFAYIDWKLIAFSYSIILIFTTYLLNLKVGDGENQKLDENTFSIISNFKQTLENKHFKQLLLAYMVSSFGAALPATLFIFYVQAYFPESNSSALLALYFIIGVITLPLWVKLSYRIGKKYAWILALLINTLSFFGVYLLKPGELNLYIFLISVSGLGYGASMVFPSSIQADIIDYEELRTGKRREGQFLGVWSLAKKTIGAISSGLALLLLGQFGFNAELQNQNTTALNALSILYCLVPCLCSLLSIFLMKSFSLDSKEHAKILKELNKNE